MSTIEQEEISQALQVELDEARRIIDIHNSMHEQGAYEVGAIARRLMDAPDKYGAGAIEHLAAAIESNATTVREWAAVARRWSKAEFNKLVARSMIEKKPKYARVSLSHLVLIQREPAEREQELVELVRNGTSVAQLRAYIRPVEQKVEVKQQEVEVQQVVEQHEVIEVQQEGEVQGQEGEVQKQPELQGAQAVAPAAPALPGSDQAAAVSTTSLGLVTPSLPQLPSPSSSFTPLPLPAVTVPVPARTSRPRPPPSGVRLVDSNPTTPATSLEQVLALARETTERLSRVGGPLLVGADEEAREAVEKVGYAEAMGQLKALVDTAVEVIDRLEDLHQPLQNIQRTSAECS